MELTMKTLKYILVIAFLLVLCSCSVDDRESELSASYSGKCIDRLSGKTVSTEYFGAALLFGDLNGDAGQPKRFYIRPDGTYNNTRMFPSSYKVWANGPFCEVDTLYFDLNGHRDFDLNVVPNISLETLSASVSNGTLSMTARYKVNRSGVSGGSCAIVYGLIENPGQNNASRSLANKTVSCWMKTSNFAGTEGVISLSIQLGDQQKYYARIGAKVNGSDYWNYTNQIQIDGQQII